MSDRDALVLTLVRGLEHAATALDVVNDATRQEVGALLSPKARQLLAALTAPATPADAADERAPAAASEEPPEPAVEETPRKKTAAAVTGFDDLPEDALGAIASFSDIKMLTCIATCRALRDATAKLSPRLEHSLVLKRFPLLTTVASSPNGAPAARDLFRTFAGFGVYPPPRAEPTVSLDAYTLLLELYVVDRRTLSEDRRTWGKQKSVFVGTGTLVPQASALATPNFDFTIPASVWEEVDDLTNGFWDLRARVVAMRRVGGRLQFASLFDAGVDNFGEAGVDFEWVGIPPNKKNEGLRWHKDSCDENDLYCQPELRLFWAVESQGFMNRQSKLEAHFILWTENNGSDEMNLTDTCLCLEHWVGWSE